MAADEPALIHRPVYSAVVEAWRPFKIKIAMLALAIFFFILFAPIGIPLSETDEAKVCGSRWAGLGAPV